MTVPPASLMMPRNQRYFGFEASLETKDYLYICKDILLLLQMEPMLLCMDGFTAKTSYGNGNGMVIMVRVRLP